MKRAWPYALALAVVVTGCYLALAPLLRSLSPGAASSATTQLSPSSSTVTVGKQAPLPPVTFTSPNKGTNRFVANTATTRKAKKKVKKPTTPTTAPATAPPSQGFAGNTPSSRSSSTGSSSSGSSSSGSSSSGSSSSSSSGSTSSSTSSATPKAPAKKPVTPSRNRATVGGAVQQTPNGDSGLAGGNDSGASDFGQTPSVGG